MEYNHIPGADDSDLLLPLACLDGAWRREDLVELLEGSALGLDTEHWLK